jgi:hypothetical protein
LCSFFKIWKKMEQKKLYKDWLMDKFYYSAYVILFRLDHQTIRNVAPGRFAGTYYLYNLASL